MMSFEHHILWRYARLYFLQVATEEIFGYSCTRHSSFDSPPCIFDAMGMSAYAWVYEVWAVVHCEMIVALVLQATISFPHVADYACSRQYLSAYNGYECIFIPALYRYKEAGLGFTADATKDSLSFDEATAMILHLTKLGLINLNSSTRSTYQPLMMLYYYFGTNLTAVVILLYHCFCGRVFVVQ